MPKQKDHVDPGVKITLRLMEANPKLKLPAAMRAAKFTLEESASKVANGCPTSYTIAATDANYYHYIAFGYCCFDRINCNNSNSDFFCL
jgi:hypothetical protein